MKRKFNEAMENFETIEKKKVQLKPFLKSLFHQYRAYGHFCLGNHKSALFDYLAIDSDSIKNDNAHIKYNQHLCEGIIAIDTNQYEEAMKLFEKSAEILP